MDFPLSRVRVSIWIWAPWLPVAIALALPPFFSEIGASGVHPAGRMGGLLAIAAAIPVWLKLRDKWPHVELPLLAMAAVGPPLLREPVATLVTMAIFIATYGFGRCACDWLNLRFKHRSVEIAIPAGIGFAAWIVVLIALGLLGRITASAIAVTLAISLIAFRHGVYRMGRLAREIHRDWHEPGAFAGIQTMFLGAMILVLQPVALTPSILYDALATHLAASRNFSLHHTLAPFGDYGFLPQGFELTMGAADTLAGQAAEQMVAPVFLGLAFVTMYAIAREVGARRRIALGGATLATALPFVQWTGAIAKNDIPMAFFLLAALLAYLQFVSGGEPGWIFAGAFLAAGAANVKHTGWMGILPLAVLFLIAAFKQPRRVRTIVSATAVLLVFGGFWMVRAAIAHGDPVYPLRAPGAMERPALQVPLLDRLAYLFRVQFQGTPIFEGNSTTRLGPFFLLFLPALFEIKRGDWNRRGVACCFFAAVYLSIWFSTWPVLRYGIAPIVLIAIAVAAGLARAIETVPAGLAGALLASVVFCHLLNLSTLVGMSLSVPRLEYLAGRMDRDTYLAGSLSSYPAIAWVREHGAAGASILAIGTHAVAYAPDPGLMSTSFPEEGPFPAGEVRSAIAGRTYRYVIISKDADLAAIFGAKSPEFADSRFAVFGLP